MTTADLALLWAAFSVAGRPVPGDFRVCDTAVKTHAGPAMLGMDAEGRRHLLVPVASSELVAEDKSGTGVHILARRLEDKAQRLAFADIACLRPDLNELFDVLITDILNAVVHTAENPAVECRVILERWRELLAQARGAKLGPDAVTGLFGELCYLLRLLKLNPAKLNAWHGPEKARHDFLCEACALEVKTTRSRRGRFCEIHGADQLEPPAGHELYLAVLRIEDAADDSLSLPDIIDQILETGVNRRNFVDALARAGYDLRDADDYRDARFRVVEDTVYHVSPEFPRIVASSFVAGSVPIGVMALAYEIDLSAEPPFPVSSEEASRMLRSLAGVDHV